MLAVDREAHDAVVAHALEGAPEEVCGVLGGRFGETESTVETAVPTRNAAPAPEYEYAIDPAEQVAVMDDLEARGLDVVGFYHSHPSGPAGPSATDADRASWPDRTYLVVDLAGDHPFVGAWRWAAAQDRFVREVLELR
jgi:proteasome lid subunit RPN8/RPN11